MRAIGQVEKLLAGKGRKGRKGNTSIVGFVEFATPDAALTPAQLVFAFFASFADKSRRSAAREIAAAAGSIDRMSTAVDGSSGFQPIRERP